MGARTVFQLAVEQTEKIAAPKVGQPRVASLGVLKRQTGLTPSYQPDREYFLCDLSTCAFKADGASLELPIFSLSKNKDLAVLRWQSTDGVRSITVTPSVLGRATMFDKDLLIYVVSQMTEALNRDRADARNRVVRFIVNDYLVSTKKSSKGGKEYNRLQTALDRLTGTRMKTNIKTGGVHLKELFGLIDNVKIVERSPVDARMIACEVTLSAWLFNAVQAHEVLTINPAYFLLRKPIAKRLYELARKHCGTKARFVIGLKLLQEKCGSRSSLNEFRSAVRAVIEANELPDYRIGLDEIKDQVLFYTRDAKRLTRGQDRK